MLPGYTFQELMLDRMKKEKWSQRKVADLVTEKVGRKIYASTINRLLADDPAIPGADVLYALAEIFEIEDRVFIRLVYAKRYAGVELSGLGNFVGEKFEKADDERQRRILEILREIK